MTRLRLTRGQIREMVEHVQDAAPEEACGLIAGTGDTARTVLQVPNRAENPTQHFVMDEIALLKSLRRMDYLNESLLAIYHSHPTSDPIPSQEDIEAAYQYPYVIYIIISLKYVQPRLKGWRIQHGQVEAVELLPDTNTFDETGDEALSPAQRYAVILAALLAFALLVGLSLSLLPPAPVLTPTVIR